MPTKLLNLLIGLTAAVFAMPRVHAGRNPAPQSVNNLEEAQKQQSLVL
jgi:hypothetical protein